MRPVHAVGRIGVATRAPFWDPALIGETRWVHVLIMEVPRIAESRVCSSTIAIVCIIIMALEAYLGTERSDGRRVVGGLQYRTVGRAVGAGRRRGIVPMAVGAVHGLIRAVPAAYIGSLRVCIGLDHRVIGRIGLQEFKSLVRHGRAKGRRLGRRCSPGEV